MIKGFKQLYLDRRFFIVLAGIILLFVLGFFFTPVFVAAKMTAVLMLLVFGLDMFALFRKQEGVVGRRFVPEKLSNGDENKIEVFIESFYPFQIHVSVIDEIPVQFQKRDFRLDLNIKSNTAQILEYYLRPVERGEYAFGALHLYISSPLKLVKKRYSFQQGQVAKVYPSFIQMRKYELLAISNKLSMIGIKKVRRLGHTMEFEQIKDYVAGDDIRSINWKATARRNKLMVNQYQDERSQQVYCLVDMGRLMKMPFNGLTLLDYAINASLVMSSVAIRKEDKAGLLTFSHKLHAFLPAEKRNNQLLKVLDILYAQQTDFKEPDFSNLFVQVRKRITHRSLLLLFTNFESFSSLKRQLPELRRLARVHLLVVIFFENTELSAVLDKKPETTEEIYLKTIAEQFAYEKRLIVKELEKYGIYSILTPPENLTVNTINKYLEFKSRGLI